MALARIRYEQLVKDTERKNNLLRTKWFMKNYADLYENPSLLQKEPMKEEVELKTAIHNLRREVYERNQEYALKKAASDTWKKPSGPMVDPRMLEGPMYPIDPVVLEQLYSGVTRDGQGRGRYLEMRNVLSPDKRYYLPASTGQEYGWKILEKAPIPDKEHCRHSVIGPSFYRRFGAVKVDSLRKRPPQPASQITFDFL